MDQHLNRQTNERLLHPLEEKVYRFSLKHKLIVPRDHVLVGVSGGPDSVALLYILKRLQSFLEVSRYSVVHVNHGLRPESKDEEIFVKSLAKSLGLDPLVYSVDVLGFKENEKLSLEMAARMCRYKAFFSAKETVKADRIAVAHHQDDQAEEILLRIFRGSGPEGLSGMKAATSEGIIRPLLSLSRSEIMSYLHDFDIPYVIDSSNEMPLFQRNRIRLEVLPLLEDIFRRPIRKIINRLREIIESEEEYWEIEIEKACKDILLKQDYYSISIDAHFFRNHSVAIQRRLVRRFIEKLTGSTYGLSFKHVEAVRKLILESRSGKTCNLKGLKLILIKEGNILHLHKYQDHPITPRKGQDIAFLEREGTFFIERFRINLELRILKAERLLSSPSNFSNAGDKAFKAFLDLASIKGSLFVRSWLAGDRFCPLGMRGKSKKVQDFFTDIKIPSGRKHTVPLFCDEEKICCILGYRIDERVKITSTTEDILEITMTSAD